jgi:carbon storage regulator
MLVLSRKSGEKIHVGEDIVIEVRRVSGNRVTIGVQAPTSLRILRGELRDAALAFEPDSTPSTGAMNRPESIAISLEVSDVQEAVSSETYIASHHRIEATSPSTFSI